MNQFPMKPEQKHIQQSQPGADLTPEQIMNLSEKEIADILRGKSQVKTQEMSDAVSEICYSLEEAFAKFISEDTKFTQLERFQIIGTALTQAYTNHCSGVANVFTQHIQKGLALLRKQS